MGFPRTEGAVQNWRDCLGAAIRPAPRVAYRNRCRRLQPPVPRQTFLPAAPKKAWISPKIWAGRKIRHADSTRRQIPCIFWVSEVAETSDSTIQKRFSSAAVPPPPKTHTSIAATWARGFPNRGPFSFLWPALVAGTAEVASRGFFAPAPCGKADFHSAKIPNAPRASADPGSSASGTNQRFPTE